MGDIFGITTYFNPSKYKSKLKNYNKFFNNISKQGLKLLCIEVAFDEQNFELTKDHADILVQLRGNSVLWQKERILNLAIERLPSDCHQVIWLDNDIIFENDDWLIEASLTLKKHKVLQPFQFVRRLGESEHCKLEGAALKKSFAYAYATNDISPKGNYGVPGYCWGGRKEVIEKIKFYDYAILGGADTIMAYGFIGQIAPAFLRHMPSNLLEPQIYWMEKAYRIIDSDIGYCAGIIDHLYHGKHSNRLYGERYSILEKTSFNPQKDLKIDTASGLWTWNCDKNSLKDYCRDYFAIRNEDE